VSRRVSSDPYRPPLAPQEPAPVALSPPLGRVALAYGVVGTLTVIVLSFTLFPVILSMPFDPRHSVGPWTAAGAASFIVPTLVHAVLGRRWWGTTTWRRLLAMLSVVCAVEACFVGDVLVITLLEDRSLDEPGLGRLLLFEMVLGVGIAPVGLIPGWIVERSMRL